MLRPFTLSKSGIVLTVGVFILQGTARAAWRPTGPFGGAAEIVRALPKTRDTVIAATHTGLVFRSANGGASWRRVAFPGTSRGVLHALEIDPQADSVWYAGVEGNNPQASGVYRTMDGGESWSLLEPTKGIGVWSLAFAPSDSRVIAAGTDSGVYVTRDGGAAWKLISPAGDPELKPVVSLAFDPADSRVIYAGTTHLPWRTGDGGATWQSIHTGMIDDSDVFSIVVDPRRPERVLASACSGAYASGDEARHWKRLDTPTGAFRTYFIALDPKRAETVFAGTSDGLLKSANGGVTWRRVSAHAVKSIAFDAIVAGRMFFASTDAGLLLSTDGGDTLRESNIGFTNRAFTGLASAGGTIYVTGAADLYRTDNLALRWQSAGAAPMGGTLLVVSVVPDEPKRLFGAGYRGLYESADGGKTWAARQGLPEGIRVRALLARQGGVLLAATDLGLFRGDRAGVWRKVAEANVESIQSAGSGAIAALSANAALLSEDEGLTWRTCAASSAGVAWYGMALDPAIGGNALAATSRGVLRSADGCRSWNAVDGGLEQATAQAVLFHPTRVGEAFVAQGGRVFRSADDGQTWLALESGDEDGEIWPSSLIIVSAAPTRSPASSS